MRRGVQSGMKGGRKKAEKGGKKEDSSGHAKALPINAISGISDPADPLFLETEPVPATYIIQVIYFMMSEGLVVLVCDVSIVTTWFGFQKQGVRHSLECLTPCFWKPNPFQQRT